jgi:hypothetical protein
MPAPSEKRYWTTRGLRRFRKATNRAFASLNLGEFRNRVSLRNVHSRIDSERSREFSDNLWGTSCQ